MWMASTPPRTQAASFERKGFHTRYSVFSPAACERKSVMVSYMSDILLGQFGIVYINKIDIPHFQRITSESGK